ncbi:GNAT family N-acetyltransferase [Streptomyces sp. NPDC048606]|uniref:GNAT family N-acetyltransferase n=1 Tax=Streptomyces sp. NPDC048606 TaxID=3154726 RepID=UPI00342A7D5E
MWEIARSWVHGWSASRSTPEPVDTPWGLTVRVGLPTQTVRHVLLDAAPDTARALIDATTEPATWIKGFLAPDRMRPWFPPHWQPTEPGFLMAVDLRPSPVRTPDGYTATIEAGPDLVTVRLLAADGRPAARGQVGLAAGACVFDQIITEENHQRRGLGTVVMATLTRAALDQGATTGILGATLQGRALYETLDWKVLAPLTGFVHRPAGA